MNDPYQTAGSPHPDGEDDSLRTFSPPDGVPAPAAMAPPASTPPQPERIGRYRIERVLGKGGFGLVYLAHDEKLERSVAIKVPHRKLVEDAGVVDIYLTEAQTVAKLDHPHIVPVYDVGQTEQFPCYVVSKFVDGCDLAGKLKQSRLSHGDAVGFVATVAEALHHAHKQGLVHRDIKPGNILLDKSNTPFVADFGLALREQDKGKGHGYLGTPAYMSPEQARGEGHRVDGRSDVFSLGVVFYELLTGRRPFQGDTQLALLEQVASAEPRPPRQVDDNVPRELDRICLKALSKRASDRYSTALDFAEDLRHWLENPHHVGWTIPNHGPTGGDSATPTPLARTSTIGWDVFVSHAGSDKATAQRLCELLEARGLRAWIAPRDIPPGMEYPEAIIRGIEASAACVVLLSAASNNSQFVAKEVERAVSKRKLLIPLRLEDIVPGPALELLLSTSQWIDAWALSLNDVVAQLIPALVAESSKGVALTPTADSGASQHGTPPVKHFLSPQFDSDSRPLKIIPKGLRSFDARDADFFLELLPGPRDRNGLPDSLRFWKSRIEETDADQTFTVGLIYGPSGCGKSSLVKAGLLPRLASSVLAVYVEATADDTETRLLNGLRKRCPQLVTSLAIDSTTAPNGLVETLAALRQGHGIPAGKKVLIVLDQFEQWLHAKKDEPDTELVRALRQCDGARVQCVVMVRDDFWLAVSRFLRDLEVRLLEGHNSALVDLFDLDHARRVLKAFGRAFGKLPDDAAPLPQPAASARADASPAPAQPLDPSANHEAFVEQAVAGLAQEEKVISVRLSLFAEMMKGKPWTPASLKAMGGTEGVGVTFLEETFSAAGAPPEHRYHQTAARTVLKSLLPEAGTDIKGHMRSRDDLLATSGYATRPKDFDDLLRLLDAEVRLISPTDPEGKTNPDGSVHDSASSLPARVRHYQLTHDYLVPSLREWLTRKQRETRKGRAELLLADRAAVWTARPENRQLPTLWQWCELQWWTESKHWTPSQQRMMRRATGHHARRGLLFGALLMIGLLAGWSIRERVVDQRNRTHAEGLVRALLNADTAQVPALLGELSEYRRWADPLLRDELLESIPGTREELHVRLALLPVYASHTDRLADRLLDGAPHEVPVLVNALAPHAESLSGRLWGAVEKPIPGRESRRLRAGAALAKYAPENPRWTAAGELIATDLVRENPVFLGQWTEAFRPVKGRLIPKLSAIFDDRHAERGAERSLATNVLADYASDRPDTLAELLATADESQFAVLFPKLQAVTDQGVPRLMAILEQSAEAGASEEDKERSAKRQANAAAALLRLNLPDRIWPLLKHNPDPRVRSYLIHRFAPLGADPEALLRRLENETDATIQKAICLSLGEYDAKSLSSEFLQRAISKLRGLFTSERDAGLHAAVQWLLSVWGDGDWLKETIDSLARDEANRARFFEKLPGSQNVASDPASTRMPPVWFVNSVGQTMVVVRGPVTFDMGSPETERNRGIDEVKESITLAGCFALASTSVTKEQFLEFKADFRYVEMFRYPEPTCPIGGVNWYLAAAYCNWLSQREGIPEDQWCYVLREGRAWYAKDHLSRTGYRLPTQAEREYATRAGTATAWSFGNSDTLLQKYGWCYENTAGGHTRTVAILKPNEFGFFDMHGNIFNWCDDKYSDAPANVAASSPTPSDVDKDEVLRTDKIMIRGGAFGSRSMFLRSAYRFSHLPTYEYGDIGLRVARTLRGSP